MREVLPHPALEHGPIYLDYNGTTPIDPRVVEAMVPFLSVHFGNPSSTRFYAHVPHTAGSTSPSEVLLAMRVERSRALGAPRLTLGHWSTSGEIDQAAQLLAQTIRTMLASVSREREEGR